jgi:hypothetical protein
MSGSRPATLSEMAAENYLDIYNSIRSALYALKPAEDRPENHEYAEEAVTEVFSKLYQTLEFSFDKDEDKNKRVIQDVLKQIVQHPENIVEIGAASPAAQKILSLLTVSFYKFKKQPVSTSTEAELDESDEYKYISRYNALRAALFNAEPIAVNQQNNAFAQSVLNQVMIAVLSANEIDIDYTLDIIDEIINQDAEFDVSIPVDDKNAVIKSLRIAFKTTRQPLSLNLNPEQDEDEEKIAIVPDHTDPVFADLMVQATSSILTETVVASSAVTEMKESQELSRVVAIRNIVNEHARHYIIGEDVRESLAKNMLSSSARADAQYKNKLLAIMQEVQNRFDQSFMAAEFKQLSSVAATFRELRAIHDILSRQFLRVVTAKQYSAACNSAIAGVISDRTKNLKELSYLERQKRQHLFQELNLQEQVVVNNVDSLLATIATVDPIEVYVSRTKIVDTFTRSMMRFGGDSEKSAADDLAQQCAQQIKEKDQTPKEKWLEATDRVMARVDQEAARIIHEGSRRPLPTAESLAQDRAARSLMNKMMFDINQNNSEQILHDQFIIYYKELTGKKDNVAAEAVYAKIVGSLPSSKVKTMKENALLVVSDLYQIYDAGDVGEEESAEKQILQDSIELLSMTDISEAAAMEAEVNIRKVLAFVTDKLGLGIQIEINNNGSISVKSSAAESKRLQVMTAAVNYIQYLDNVLKAQPSLRSLIESAKGDVRETVSELLAFNTSGSDFIQNMNKQVQRLNSHVNIQWGDALQTQSAASKATSSTSPTSAHGIFATSSMRAMQQLEKRRDALTHTLNSLTTSTTPGSPSKR